MPNRATGKDRMSKPRPKAAARRADYWVSVIDPDKRDRFSGLDFNERIDAMVREFDEKRATKPRKAASSTTPSKK